MSENENIIGRLSVRYSSSPTVKALVNILPGGGSLDSLMSKRAEEIKHERLQTFFDELKNGEHELTPELIESEDFLHCYFSTVSAAVKSRRREKICMFAKLLNSTAKISALKDTDEFEDYLSILDEMSYREIQVVTILDKYENSYPINEGENKLQRSSRFWDQFLLEVERFLGIPKLEIEGLLTRLNRTGCYETFVGGFLGYSGGHGCLTATYFKLKDLLNC